MNCADFEEAIAADPGGNPACDEHATSCAACTALRDEYRELDQKIARALSVPVPQLSIPTLDETAPDTSNVAVLTPRRRVTTPVWFGLAATIALGAWLGLQWQQPDVSQLTLAEQVVAHLDHETFSRVISDTPVSERTLRSVVSKDVMELDHDVGLVSYARSCVINGRAIPHLVVQGKNGPITLLLMPDEKVAEAISLSGHAINGVILPIGNGSVAIIGERDEPLQEIEQSIVASIKWTT